MRILFLSRWRPWPTNNGSKLRIYNLLAALGRRHEVSLICFREADETEPDAAELREICSSVRSTPRKSFDPWSARSLTGFLHPTPRSVLDTRSDEMETLIQMELAGGEYDLVIASQIEMAAYASSFGSVPAVFEELELGVCYGRCANAASATSRLRNRLTWTKHKRFVQRLLPKFRVATVVSSAERDLAVDLGAAAADIEVVPNAVDLSRYDVVAQRNPETLVFTGSFAYEPNYRGMIWFLENVWPALAAKRPNLRVIVTGDHGGRTLPNPEAVTLTGYVDDVRPLVAGAVCAIVPLLEGGGTRLKILEAMASRTPVVSTSKGAEGLDAVSGEHLLLADQPAAFAEALETVLSSATLREKLSESAYRLVAERYDSQSVAERLLALVDRVGGPRVEAAEAA